MGVFVGWLSWVGGRKKARASDPQNIEPQSFEARLVAKARAGDRAAFGKLHNIYARMVHGVLISRVPPHEADDLTQDVFLTALQRLNQLKDDNAFGPWLAAIARRRSIDFLRQRKETSELPEELAGKSRPKAEVMEALRAIQSLPEAYRETLAMRLVEGMTGPEIAARTGLTPGSVRVNLHRGMKLLRSNLGVEEES